MYQIYNEVFETISSWFNNYLLEFNLTEPEQIIFNIQNIEQK